MAITQHIRRMGNKRHAAVLEKLDQYFAFAGEDRVTIGERINTIQNPELRAVLQAMVDYRDIPMSRTLVSKYVNSYSEVITRRVLQQMLDNSWYNPNLSLDFTTMTALPAGITFTRADPGTFFDKDGLMKVQGYNLLLQSEDFSTTWGLSNIDAFGAGSVVNAVVSPSGSLTADFLRESSSGVLSHTASQSVTKAASAITYTYSVYMKAGTRTWGRLLISNAALTAFASVYVNLATGALGASGATATTFTGVSASTPVGVGNGWYRVSLTATTDTDTTVKCWVGIASADNTASYVGDGTSGLYAWGAQLEAGSTATQYSPTTTAANSAPRLDYDPATPIGTTGVELVTNGAFTDTSNWALTGSAIPLSVANGELVVTGDGSGFAQARQTITGLTVGKTYAFTATARRGSTGFNVVARIGGGSGLTLLNTSSTSNVTATGNYVAQATSANIDLFVNNGASTGTAYFDNISVQEVTFAPRGLLVEEQRTNLCLQSQAPNSWAGPITAGTTITPDTAIAPDGTQTADTFAMTGTAYYYSNQAYTTTGAHTASVYLKAASNVTVGLRLSNSAGTEAAFVSCAVTTAWQRFNIPVTFTVNPVNLQIGLDNRTGFGGNSGTNTVFAWGFQVEAGSFPTSYIPTTTASATRSADSALMNGTNFSSWFNFSAGPGTAAGPGTFVVESDQVNIGSQMVLHVDDGTVSNRIYLNTSSGTRAFNVEVATVTQVAFAVTGALTANTTSKTAVCYATNDFAGCTNGGTVGVDTSGTLPTVNAMLMGVSRSGSTASYLNGHIRRIQYYPTRLPNATLQSLTA